MGKTKVMRCRDSESQVVKSGNYPCGVCSKGVGSNSIQCTSCHAWIHKKCRGITGKLKHVDDYQCRSRCREGNPVRSDVLQQSSLGNSQSVYV